MVRKQNDYLASLLQETEAARPSPAPSDTHGERPRGLTLLARETALGRVASGELRQVTQLALDPARVRVWQGNARSYAALTETHCQDLIDSIIAEGGQRVPAIVRRVDGDEAHDYEVIAGTRRHWAISWLRAHSYPDMKFIAQVHDLDDEAAFRIADIENRARKDVSDIERARNYAGALATHYGGHQTRMAERLKISKGWLSKMIKVAHVGDEVLVAFADPREISLAAIYPLAQAMDDAAFAKAVQRNAKTLAKEQDQRRTAGTPPLPAPEVIRRLRASNRTEIAAPKPYRANSHYGRTALSIEKTDRQGVTIRLHSGSGASRPEVLKLVDDALGWLEGQGKGLMP